MNDGNGLSRRAAMSNLMLVVVGAATWGCKKELVCTDTAGLTAAERTVRTSLGYVDQSLEAAKVCEGCQLYQPAGPDGCGGCLVVKGPIHPRGYCTSWVKKQG